MVNTLIRNISEPLLRTKFRPGFIVLKAKQYIVFNVDLGNKRKLMINLCSKSITL